MGQLRFKTALLKSSKGGIDRMGSNPRVDMGGSVKGDKQSLTRPSLLASKKASWVTEPPLSPRRWTMNYQTVLILTYICHKSEHTPS